MDSVLTIIAPLRGSHGLSARRARRTKSSRPEGPKAGPKGRKLEVGARRAPRLLVLTILVLLKVVVIDERGSGTPGEVAMYSFPPKEMKFQTRLIQTTFSRKE